jgi:hypothetical protein
MITNGCAVEGVPATPLAGIASTTWNRMPLACTSRCRQGPSIRVTDGSGGAIYQPDGSAGIPPCAELSAGAEDLSWPGVKADRVSFTDSMVCRGPRMRRTFR